MSVSQIASARQPGASSSARKDSLARRMWKGRQGYFFIAPFMVTFLIFVVLPIFVALGLSFYSFNGISQPRFIGWDNYLAILTQDITFLQHALPNTFKFALFVGPIGYLMTFFLAWLINELPKSIRDIFTLALYAPSLAAGVAMSVVWVVIFAGDNNGYLNGFLMKLGFIAKPIPWLTTPDHYMTIMIVIALWSSMGVGFLAIIAGLQTINQELYEAGAIDGITNRLQEITYITIPAIKPQMLFSAVMAIVGTLRAGDIGSNLSISVGQKITPNYAGHLMSSHINDFATVRFEFGYSAALTVVLLLIVYACTRLSFRLFGTKEGE